MEKFKGILLSAVFLLTLFGGGAAFFLSPGQDYSETERRMLASAPKAGAGPVLDGSFFDDLNSWMTERFPGRDNFRTLNTLWSKKVLRQVESDGYVQVDGSIIRLEKKVNDESLRYAQERFLALYDTLLSGTGCSIYAAMVPEKSYFLASAGYPVMDYDEMESRFDAAVPGARSVSLVEALSLESYFLTDSHWRQDRIIPAANALLAAMGAGEVPDTEDFSTAGFSPFYGVYAGQSALHPEPEEIRWYTGGYLESLRAVDGQTRTPVPVADPDGCDPRDPYTLFLGGSLPLVRIGNPSAGTDRELVIFRDSFASAIAPLLAGSYRTVTLIDPRYISADAIRRYVHFTNQDVLFLFSAILLNNSAGLKDF